MPPEETPEPTPLSIIHDVNEEPPAPTIKSPEEIVLLPEPPKKQRKQTVREKSKKIVKEIYPLILKRTDGNYRLIGRTIRTLYRIYLHHTQEKLKDPITFSDAGADKTARTDTPPKGA